MTNNTDEKLDEAITTCERISALLEASNRRAFELYERAPDPLPMRGGRGLVYWLAIFALFAFFSGAVYQAAAAQSPFNRCIEALAEDVNPRIMAPQTARRRARAVCQTIRSTDRYFFKALTQ